MIRLLIIGWLFLLDANAQINDNPILKYSGKNGYAPLDRRGEYVYPMSGDSLAKDQIDREIKENERISGKLAHVKYEIINGNIEKAKLILLNSKYSTDFSRPIQYRYLAIIYFIEGNYARSLEVLQNKEMYNLGYQDKICMLRTLNYLILGRHIEALNDWSHCLDATVSKSPTFHVWMNTLVHLKSSKNKADVAIPLAGVNIENEKGDFLRIFLKLALYLNQQKIIFSRIPYLGIEVYQDENIRELLGMLYYREGKLVDAYKFIEDLTSPNAEVIKGNLYLAQEKYELAYAQFKLALERKSNSQNALERIVPTAWILKQWKDGLYYTEKMASSEADKYKKLALKAAFQAQLEKYTEAKDTLETIVRASKNAQAPEVNQIYTYVGLMLNNVDLTSEYADKSCKNLEGINCWLQYQLIMWENFPITTKRKDEVHNAKSNILNQFRSEYKETPLDEEIFINQRDIEELDNELIELMRP